MSGASHGLRIRKLVDLNTSIERLEDNKVRFEITIDAKEVDSEIDSIYKQVNRTSRIPGFRKGKAPRSVLKHTFGDDYFNSQATVNLIERHSPAVVDDADMIALRDYEYESPDAMVEPGSDFTYSFTIVVKPEMEISSSDPVEIELPSTVATEKEIDDRIELLRSYYIDLATVEDRPVQAGDLIGYSRTCEINGTPIDEGAEENSTHVIAEEPSDAFDEGLIGMEIGETKDIEISSDVLGLEEKYPSVKITAKVTINTITERKAPELTDEWVQKTCDAENVEALRKQIAESITSEKVQKSEHDKSRACLEALADRLQGEVPKEVVEDSRTTALRNAYLGLQNQGITLDDYLRITGISTERFYDGIAEQGNDLAKRDMALDALARDLGCELTDEDIEDAFSDLEDPDEARREWEESHRMALLRESLLRDKAAKWLYENAKVTYVDPGEETENEAEEAGGED